MASPDTLDEFTYGYDRVGNRLWKENVLAGDQTTPVHLDELHSYDELYRLIGTDRGNLNAAKDGIIGGTGAFTQAWDLDGVGNWAGFDEDTNGDGTNELEQTRNVNTANEIANLAGGGWVGPTYDAAGNMISSPRPGGETGRLFFTYDGWNRLTKVHVDTDADALFEPTTGDALVADYEYDGRNRRIEKSVTASGGGARDVDYFYNESWQLLESQTVTGAVTSIDQTIWDISYIDAPAVHYHDANGDGDYLDTGDTIQYHTWDANQNITATITADGTITTRYIYTPYGEVTATTATWSTPTVPTTDAPLYAGYHFDSETALHHVRNRQYHPTLGKFTTRDPIAYAAGDTNLYRYVGNGPTIATDPSGLQPDGQSLGHWYIEQMFEDFFKSVVNFFAGDGDEPQPIGDGGDASSSGRSDRIQGSRSWLPFLGKNQDFLYDFLYGEGETRREYGDNHPMTDDMRNSTGVARMRDEFYRSCRKNMSYEHRTFSAALDTIPDWDTWGKADLQVGGWTGEAHNNGNGTVTFTIKNVAGRKSFFYHRADNNPEPEGPMRTIHQTFTWTESIDQNYSPRPEPQPHGYKPPTDHYDPTPWGWGTKW